MFLHQNLSDLFDFFVLEIICVIEITPLFVHVLES